MPNGALYRQAAEFQRQLAERDAALARLLVERYGVAYRRLSGSFDSLALRVARDIEQGRVFTIDRLRRLDRYVALMRQVDGEIDEFSRYAARQIAKRQADEAREALRTASQLRATAEQRGLVSRPEVEGYGAFPRGADEARIGELFGRLTREPLYHLFGVMADGTPLYNYFRLGTATVPGLSADVVERIRGALEQALIEGWNPRKAAAYFRDAMGVGLTRSLAIARTETLRAYREATRFDYITYGVERWEWHAAMDIRTCCACAALDGEIFDVYQEPDMHVNCLCTMVPVIGEPGPRERRVQWPEEGTFVGNGRDWFESLTDDQKREWMGGGNFNAWKAGAVTLQDFIGDRTHPVFGHSYVQESLVGILGDDAAQYYVRNYGK